jgi:membrane dipeptidase
MAGLKGADFLRDELSLDLMGGSLSSLDAPGDQHALYGETQMRGGLTALHISVGKHMDTLEPVLTELYDGLCLFDQMSHRVLHVRSVADLHEAKATNRVGVILGSQGLNYIGSNTRLLLILARLGLRIAAISDNEENLLGSGCLEPADRGLTLLGRRAVRELRANGIALDLTQVGYRTGMDAIDLYNGPVLFTHSNASAVTPNPHNINDDQIRAAAETGGMVGVSPFSAFCRNHEHRRPTIEDYVAHIDYIASLVGVDHVGIGTDLSPYTKLKWENGTKRDYPEMVGDYVWETAYADGFDSHAKFTSVPEALDRRGYKPDDIRKIMGGNAIRVLDAAWTLPPR